MEEVFQSHKSNGNLKCICICIDALLVSEINSNCNFSHQSHANMLTLTIDHEGQQPPAFTVTMAKTTAQLAGAQSIEMP